MCDKKTTKFHSNNILRKTFLFCRQKQQHPQIWNNLSLHSNGNGAKGDISCNYSFIKEDLPSRKDEDNLKHPAFD